MNAGKSNWNSELEDAIDLHNNLLHYSTTFPSISHGLNLLFYLL